MLKWRLESSKALENLDNFSLGVPLAYVWVLTWERLGLRLGTLGCRLNWLIFRSRFLQWGLSTRDIKTWSFAICSRFCDLRWQNWLIKRNQQIIRGSAGSRPTCRVFSVSCHWHVMTWVLNWWHSRRGVLMSFHWSLIRWSKVRLTLRTTLPSSHLVIHSSVTTEARWALAIVNCRRVWHILVILTLAEDELVVVLVHLSNILLQDVSISNRWLGSRLLVLLQVARLELLFETLGGFHWVKDGSGDWHGLLKVGRSQFAHFGVGCNQRLHCQRKGVCLCKEPGLWVGCVLVNAWHEAHVAAIFRLVDEGADVLKNALEGRLFMLLAVSGFV